MKSSEKKINFGDRKIYTNEWGQVILQNKKNSKIFAERTYYWNDTVTLIDETDGRRLIGIKQQSYFLEKDWTPILPEEYKQIERNYSEITTIRREVKLQKLFS